MINLTKCNKTLKLLRLIGHKDWSADQHTLLKLYRTLICSKIDYGYFIYGAARKTYFKPLNTVHHEGLRLTLGAFRTSPVESLYAEAYEPPLKLRIIKLGLQYYCKLQSLVTNPAHDCIFYPIWSKRKDHKTFQPPYETCIGRDWHFIHKHSWYHTSKLSHLATQAACRYPWLK